MKVGFILMTRESGCARKFTHGLEIIKKTNVLFVISISRKKGRSGFTGGSGGWIFTGGLGGLGGGSWGGGGSSGGFGGFGGGSFGGGGSSGSW